jgi:hypothetical protein
MVWIRQRGWDPDVVTINDEDERPERSCDLPGCNVPAEWSVNDWLHTAQNSSSVGPDPAVFCSHAHRVKWNQEMYPDFYGPDREAGREPSRDYPRNPR